MSKPCRYLHPRYYASIYSSPLSARPALSRLKETSFPDFIPVQQLNSGPHGAGSSRLCRGRQRSVLDQPVSLSTFACQQPFESPGCPARSVGLCVLVCAVHCCGRPFTCCATGSSRPLTGIEKTEPNQTRTKGSKQFDGDSTDITYIPTMEIPRTAVDDAPSGESCRAE